MEKYTFKIERNGIKAQITVKAEDQNHAFLMVEKLINPEKFIPCSMEVIKGDAVIGYPEPAYSVIP